MSSSEFTRDEPNLPARLEIEEVREGFWPKIRRFAARIPFAEDALAAYYCAFDRETPAQVRITLVAALAYFVLPVDALPDILPMLGFVDDASVLAGAIAAVAGSIEERHRAAARAALKRLASEPG